MITINCITQDELEKALYEAFIHRYEKEYTILYNDVIIVEFLHKSFYNNVDDYEDYYSVIIPNEENINKYNIEDIVENSLRY